MGIRKRKNQVINRPHNRGGTGLCSFGEDDLVLYQVAVEKFADPFLEILPQPLRLGDRDLEALEDYSLHDTRRRPDLSAFWRVFDQIEELDHSLGNR